VGAWRDDPRCPTVSSTQERTVYRATRTKPRLWTKLQGERLTAAQTILNRLGERFYAEHVERALAETERS
jgi:hypothetical protein